MPRHRRSLAGRLVRWTLGLTLAVLLVAGALALIGWRLSRSAPAWWAPVDPRAQLTIDAAEAIENDLASEMHRADRPPVPGISDTWTSEPWSFAIRDADANAWLGVRLRPWIANREPDLAWPDPLDQIQVEFDRGLIRVGVHLESDHFDQIVAMALVPEIRDDGALWLRISTIHLGRLPVPASVAMDQLASRLDLGDDRSGDLRRTVDALLGRAPLVGDPVITLSDGRLVRLLAITPRADRIDITCQTIRPRD